MAEFALNEVGATKLATIHDESPYTQGLTAAAALNFEAGDGTVTVQEQINPKTPTSSRCCDRSRRPTPTCCTPPCSSQRVR